MTEHTVQIQTLDGSWLEVEPTGRARGDQLEIYYHGGTKWVPTNSVLPEHQHRIPTPQRVRDEEQRGILCLSEVVLQECQDEHLRWLVNRVWSRLPAADRQVLTDLVASISDREARVYTNLGFRYLANVVSWKNLLRPIERATSLTHRVSLAEARTLKTDEARLFVIARELAHVLLRQPQLAVIRVRTVETEASTAEQIKEFAQVEEWMTEQAVLQVCLWGFQREYEIYLAANSQAKPPDWYRESFPLPAYLHAR